MNEWNELKKNIENNLINAINYLVNLNKLIVLTNKLIKSLSNRLFYTQVWKKSASVKMNTKMILLPKLVSNLKFFSA